MDCSTAGSSVPHYLPELAQTQVHRVSDAIQPPYLLSSPCPPAFNLSQHHGLFQWVSPSFQVAKVLEFQLQHQSFQRNIQNWFPLWLTVGPPCNPKDSKESSTSQFKNINSSALSFLYSQLSYPYMTTGKTIALTRWTFVDKVMSLLFNMLSKLVITFLLRSKHLLISWLQSPSAVILEPPKIKSDTISTKTLSQSFAFPCFHRICILLLNLRNKKLVRC